MNETPILSLPLIQPSQAQKHVTVNEALVRLDGLTQISILSRSVSTPPAAANDGDCYAVPTGATGGWSGQDGMLAIVSNGGWIFVQPQAGWSAWIVDEHARARFVSGAWHAGVLGAAENGGLSRFVVKGGEHVVSVGGAQTTALEIPANSMVFACSARVMEAITGDLSSWTLDVADGSLTFGSGMGLQVGSYCTGILSQPTTLYSAQAPRISPVGGSFAGGRLELAIHYYSIDLPV